MNWSDMDDRDIMREAISVPDLRYPGHSTHEHVCIKRGGVNYRIMDWYDGSGNWRIQTLSSLEPVGQEIKGREINLVKVGDVRLINERLYACCGIRWALSPCGFPGKNDGAMWAPVEQGFRLKLETNEGDSNHE